MGRPPLLSPARLRQARTWAGQGLTHAEIGRKLGVSRSRISELLKQHGVLPAPSPLSGGTGKAGGTGSGGTGADDEQADARAPAGPADHDGGQDPGDRAAGAGAGGEGAGWRVAARIETGTVACRYAGAMLVHAFTDRIGARGLLSAGTGASAARHTPADDLGILVCTQMSFTLGALTLEQTKHLIGCRRRSAGRTDVPAVTADLAAAPGRAG